MISFVPYFFDDQKLQLHRLFSMIILFHTKQLPVSRKSYAHTYLLRHRNTVSLYLPVEQVNGKPLNFFFPN